MTKKRIIENPELLEEQPIFLLILSEGGVPVYSHWFIRESDLGDHLFGGFLSSINAFIKDAFSEGLDRASFGQYKLLMKSIAPFLICYIFKGPSYYALQRANLFIEKMLIQKETWQKLENFYRTNRIVQKNDISSLEPLITEIFIEKKSF
jgi:hypothetical protein